MSRHPKPVHDPGQDVGQCTFRLFWFRNADPFLKKNRMDKKIREVNQDIELHMSQFRKVCWGWKCQLFCSSCSCHLVWFQVDWQDNPMDDRRLATKLYLAYFQLYITEIDALYFFKLQGVSLILTLLKCKISGQKISNFFQTKLFFMVNFRTFCVVKTKFKNIY